MAFWNRKRELRATSGQVQFDDQLLRAMISGTPASKEMALQLPAVSGGIDLIASIIAGTPLHLHREKDGKICEVEDDPRVRLLNDETGDTLNANDFWHAMIRDYYVGKGAYAYLHRVRGKIVSLHYVDESKVSIIESADPIFKDYDILVNGQRYMPHQFFKLLRNTRNGATGTSIVDENGRLIETAYKTLLLERKMADTGGRKKGFLNSERKLEEGALNALRESFARLYAEDSTENFVVLNSGIKFSEMSDTAAEMQLTERKRANTEEFAKLFHVSPAVMGGTATQSDITSLAKLAAIPLMTAIECALNRDLLTEAEKGELYWAFDTRELLKADMRERFEAYKIALDANFMQVDEVRYIEDMEPLGLPWIKMGLNDVLYDPQTKVLYTPNTNKVAAMDKREFGKGLQRQEEPAMIEEERANPNHDPKTGRFTTGSGRKTRGTKYTPSPQLKSKPKGKQVGKQKYGILCGIAKTKYPLLKPEDGKVEIYHGTSVYTVSAKKNGGIIIHKKEKLE